MPVWQAVGNIDPQLKVSDYLKLEDENKTLASRVLRLENVIEHVVSHAALSPRTRKRLREALLDRLDGERTITLIVR